MGGTPVPGKDSFTSALIQALEYLVENKPGGRFTTVELLNRIKYHSPDFAKDQTPILSDRQYLGLRGKLMLSPLHLEGPKDRILPEEAPSTDLAKTQTVTLHFDFSERPLLENVETLGTELNRIFEEKALGVNGVRWGGLKRSLTAQAIERFLNASKRRKRESLNSDSSDGPSSQSVPGFLTPVSSGQDSPRIMDKLGDSDVVMDQTLLSPVFPPDGNEASGFQRQNRSKKRKTVVKGLRL